MSIAPEAEMTLKNARTGGRNDHPYGSAALLQPDQQDGHVGGADAGDPAGLTHGEGRISWSFCRASSRKPWMAS